MERQPLVAIAVAVVGVVVAVAAGYRDMLRIADHMVDCIHPVGHKVDCIGHRLAAADNHRTLVADTDPHHIADIHHSSGTAGRVGIRRHQAGRRLRRDGMK